jgi:hypothetical protein
MSAKKNTVSGLSMLINGLAVSAVLTKTDRMHSMIYSMLCTP